MAETDVRVLIADDNREIRCALRLLLQESDGGLQDGDTTPLLVEEAADAFTALDRLERQPLDVVLLDWELPGLPSDRLVGEIKTRCPHCVVIAMSGHPEARSLSLQMGVDGFASKGEPPDRLLALLRLISARVGRCDDADQPTQMVDTVCDGESGVADETGQRRGILKGGARDA